MLSSVSEAHPQKQPFILNHLPMRIVFLSMFYRVRKRKCESWHSDGVIILWTNRVNLMKTEVCSTVIFVPFIFLSTHAFPKVSNTLKASFGCYPIWTLLLTAPEIVHS